MTFGKAEEAMKVFKYCIQDSPPEACSSEFKGQNWYVLFFVFFNLQEQEASSKA